MKHIDKKSIKSSLRRGLLTGLVAGLPFAMLADIMVTGRVIDAGTGAILPGARITVVDGTATAMTNGEGEYKLNAPKGNVTLKIEAPGFNPAYVDCADRPHSISVCGPTTARIQSASPPPTTVSQTFKAIYSP